MAKFKIEKMCLAHLDDVMEIETACYGEHHWARESFANEIDNAISEYLCAVNEEGRCIGYLGMWKIVDEAHITNFAVHPGFQKQGAGHFLIVNSIERCYEEKIKFITLEVRASNDKAKRLYEKFGFKSLGVRKKYYQNNNEDAVIMWTQNIFDESYKKLFEENKQFLKEILI